MHEAYTKVAGNTYIPGGQELLAALKSNQELTLKRDKQNQYDKNAVEIIANDKRIGYLPAHVAREVAPRMDNDANYKCYVSEVTGGGNKHYGCNLKLVLEDIDEPSLPDLPSIDENDFFGI